MKNKLTIAIPTYNRKEDLCRLLKSILIAKNSFLSEIIISDNCSNYDIHKVLKDNFPTEFLSTCRIIKNPYNIGGPGNIRNQFLLCKTKWLWLIGDDDEVTKDSFDIIYNDVNKDPECAFFKYSISYKLNNKTSSIIESESKIDTITKFIDYYNNNNNHIGSMVFMSNNIFNMNKLTPYMYSAFTYSTSITHLLPILLGLDKKDVYMRIKNSIICKYIEPNAEQHWNYMRILLAISTVPHIPFRSINEKEMKNLMGILTLLNFRSFVSWAISNKKDIQRWELVEILYKNLYCYSRMTFDSILFFMLKLEYKYNIKILSNLKKIYKSIVKSRK